MHAGMCVCVCLSPYQILRAWLHWFLFVRNITALARWFISVQHLVYLVPLVCLLTKFYVPSYSDFSPFQISHALLQRYIFLRNFACLAPLVLLVSAIKLWAEDNFCIYLMVFLYTLRKQTSRTLSRILSGPWRKFLLRILCFSYFTSSYRLWEINKHDVGDINQWRSFYTRIRENRFTASKVVLLQNL